MTSIFYFREKFSLPFFKVGVKLITLLFYKVKVDNYIIKVKNDYGSYEENNLLS